MPFNKATKSRNNYTTQQFCTDPHLTHAAYAADVLLEGFAFLLRPTSAAFLVHQTASTVKSAKPSLPCLTARSRPNCDDSLLGPGTIVRYDQPRPIPASTPVGHFSCIVALGKTRRDIHTVPLPTTLVHGIHVDLAVYASAWLACFCPPHPGGHVQPLMH